MIASGIPVIISFKLQWYLLSSRITNLFVKVYIVNILASAVYMVSVATTHLCHSSEKAARGST